jgi:hypothetical protein
VGAIVGNSDGVGLSPAAIDVVGVGDFVGSLVGDSVGLAVGSDVGRVGTSVGDIVNDLAGAGVMLRHTRSAFCDGGWYSHCVPSAHTVRSAQARLDTRVGAALSN